MARVDNEPPPPPSRAPSRACFSVFSLVAQVAHIHVRHPTDVPTVRRILEKTPGVEKVMDGSELDAYYRSKGTREAGRLAAPGEGRRAAGPRGAHDPERSGELVAISEPNSWFAYYYWMNDAMAPDFARCVAIHRKPGYDPAEMFFRYPGFRGFAWLILKLFLGYGLKLRTIVDATPLRCDGIRGSHGRLPEGDGDPRPLLAFRAKRVSGAAEGGEAKTGGAMNTAGKGSGGERQEDAEQGKEEVAVGGVVPSVGPAGGELGREACSDEGGVVVAEDVYEILWRILSREI